MKHKLPIIALLVLFFCSLSLNILAAESWRFVCFGDARGNGSGTPDYPYVNTTAVQAISHAVTNDAVSFVLFLGDMVYGQREIGELTLSEQIAIWTNAMSEVYAAGIPVYVIRGNHETISFSSPAWIEWSNSIGNTMPQNGPDNEKGMTYSFSCSNAFFVGMDLYNGTNSSILYNRLNQEWLSGQLTSNTLPHVFVFTHAPAFAPKASESECLAIYPTNRNAFWQSLGRANCRVYLDSHFHTYGRAKASVRFSPWVHQIIIGNGGAPPDLWDGTYSEGGMTSTNLNISNVVLHAENYQPGTNYIGYLLTEITDHQVTMLYKATSNYTDPSPTWVTNDVFTYDLDIPDPVPKPVDYYNMLLLLQ